MNKNILLSLIKRDLVYGYKKSKSKYIVLSIVFICINLILVHNMKLLGEQSMWTHFIEVFKGISYEINIHDFQLPISWILVNISIIFIIGSYVSEDLEHNGIYMIIRGGRANYWLSKIIWIIINVVVYYILLFLITLIIGGIFTTGNSIQNIDLMGLTTIGLLIYTFVLYISTSVMLGILYITLSMVIKYNYSYLFIIFMLIASLFIKSNLMPGQHSLILRHVPFDTNFNLTLVKSLMYNIILTLSCVAAGIGIMKRKDIF